MTARRWTDDKLRALLAESERVSRQELAARHGMGVRNIENLLSRARRVGSFDTFDQQRTPAEIRVDLIKRNAKALQALKAEALRSLKKRNAA